MGPQRVVRVTPSWVVRGDAEGGTVEFNRREQFVVSLTTDCAYDVGAVAGRKTRAVDRLRKASIDDRDQQSKSSHNAGEVSPHHAGDAYDSLATTVA